MSRWRTSNNRSINRNRIVSPATYWASKDNLVSNMPSRSQTRSSFRRTCCSCNPQSMRIRRFPWSMATQGLETLSMNRGSYRMLRQRLSGRRILHFMLLPMIPLKPTILILLLISQTRRTWAEKSWRLKMLSMALWVIHPISELRTMQNQIRFKESLGSRYW